MYDPDSCRGCSAAPDDPEGVAMCGTERDPILARCREYTRNTRDSVINAHARDIIEARKYRLLSKCMSDCFNYDNQRRRSQLQRPCRCRRGAPGGHWLQDRVVSVLEPQPCGLDLRRQRQLLLSEASEFLQKRFASVLPRPSPTPRPIEAPRLRTSERTRGAPCPPLPHCKKCPRKRRAHRVQTAN
jgi:hypothetical protein